MHPCSSMPHTMCIGLNMCVVRFSLEPKITDFFSSNLDPKYFFSLMSNKNGCIRSNLKAQNNIEWKISYSRGIGTRGEKGRPPNQYSRKEFFCPTNISVYMRPSYAPVVKNKVAVIRYVLLGQNTPISIALVL